MNDLIVFDYLITRERKKQVPLGRFSRRYWSINNKSYQKRKEREKKTFFEDCSIDLEFFPFVKSFFPKSRFLLIVSFFCVLNA